MLGNIKIITLLKNLGYIPAILIGLSLESYVILGVLMVVDTFFGVVRVRIVHGGKHIKSSKLVSGIASKAMIMVVPLLLAWAGRGAGFDMTTVAQAVLGMFIIAETYSILGSITSIYKGKDVPEYDFISMILGFVQRFIESFLRAKLSPDDDVDTGKKSKSVNKK